MVSTSTLLLPNMQSAMICLLLVAAWATSIEAAGVRSRVDSDTDNMSSGMVRQSSQPAQHENDDMQLPLSSASRNLREHHLNEPDQDFKPRKLLREIRVPDPDEEVSTRVINGHDTKSGRYPYYVHMWQASLCGGALIGPNLVLTAAHCRDAANIVKVGRHNRYGGDGADTIPIEKKIVHPMFNEDPEDFPYDLMLLVLTKTTDKPYVKINSKGSVPNENDPLGVLGFGDMTIDDTDLSLPTYLQETDLHYIDNSSCQSMHTDNEITDDMLCASAPGKDACRGDSGGPLIIPGATHEDDVLVGSVAWGRGCADANFPGVYSRMSYFYDWIVETACKESDHAPPSFNCQRQAASTTKAPTDAPTDEPTSAPTSPPTKTPNGSFGFRSIPQLDYLGWNPSSSYPLALCQGDCDADDQCGPGLVCFQRHSAETNVPGCGAAATGVPAVADFCIEDPGRR